MSSQSRATRENQQKVYEQRLQARQNVLEKRGIAPTELKKDKVFEHLKAKHQAIVNAIAAIDVSRARKDQPEAKDANKAAPAPAPTKQKKEKPEKAPKAAPAGSTK